MTLPTPKSTLERILKNLAHKVAGEEPDSSPTPITNIEKYLQYIFLSYDGTPPEPPDPPEPEYDAFPAWSTVAITSTSNNVFALGQKFRVNTPVKLGGFKFTSPNAGTVTIYVANSSGIAVASAQINSPGGSVLYEYFFDTPVDIASGEFTVYFNSTGIGYNPLSASGIHPDLVYVGGVYSTNASSFPTSSDGVNKNSLVPLIFIEKEGG